MNDIEYDFASVFGLSFCIIVDIGREKSLLLILLLRKMIWFELKLKVVVRLKYVCDVCVFLMHFIQTNSVHFYSIFIRIVMKCELFGLYNLQQWLLRHIANISNMFASDFITAVVAQWNNQFYNRISNSSFDGLSASDRWSFTILISFNS